MSEEEIDASMEEELDEMEEEEEELEENSIEEEMFHEDLPKISRSQSFDVLPQDLILQDTKKLIEEVQQVCGIPTAAAATVLLRHFKWNKEKLIEAYLEDPKKTCVAAGMSTLELETPAPKTQKTFSCLICLEDLPAQETYALGCGHRYCKDCWRGFLEVLVKDGPRSVYAKCPAPKCQMMVHEKAYKDLLKPQLFDKYQYFLFRSFVEDNPQLKWCPAPGCTYAVRCERIGRKQAVNCKCGFSFCFRCADNEIGDHNPVTCEYLEKWLQKASDESENVKWMIANTKKCPKCRSPIEKNGGCMHMTCRIPSCAFEFCWLCRGPWTEHGSATGGFYQCNKYDVSEAKKEDEKANDVKTELETYMFYFHRYESHRNAGKIANQQRQTCTKKEQSILDKFDVRAQDTKFLTEATEQLIKNRRVLEYSYCMGYFLDKSKPAEKNLFEYLQEELEKHTNHLSELYEQSVDSIPDYHAFMKWKEEVTNYTRVTKKFLENFLEGTAEGLTFIS